MTTKRIALWLGMIGFLWASTACQGLKTSPSTAPIQLPDQFGNLANSDSSIAQIPWRQYFNLPGLQALIDSALVHNQELHIVEQEVLQSRYEIRAHRGEYLPFVGLQMGSGLEKPGRYTRQGALEHGLEIKPGQPFPEPLPDHLLGFNASWEIDLWKKLRHAKKSAISRYLATEAGKNLAVTELVAEMANAYYELLALDNLLAIVTNNIELQASLAAAIRSQKAAGKVSQLAVNRFEAQLLHTQNLQYDILQRRVETENHLNFLAGRSPQPIERDLADFEQRQWPTALLGHPSKLLENRPDIRQAAFAVEAAKLDLKVARAQFYPALRLQSQLGYQAFAVGELFNPASLMYAFAGDLAAPLINRNALMANYQGANARQKQALLAYEQALLTGYVEVLNQWAFVQNSERSVVTKAQEVALLNESIDISKNLFNAARADYLEVLLTQQEALESTLELNELKLQQFKAKIGIYRALGGGWR